MSDKKRLRWQRGFAISLLVYVSNGFVNAETDENDIVLRAGAATSNVTPRLGVSIAGHMRDRSADHVHDELHARCLVLDDGETQLAFAIVDSCMIPASIFDEAKSRASRVTGIPVGNMLMSATHTHSAPCATPVFQTDPDPTYQAFMTQRIADGVTRAFNNLQPAHIGWGVGKLADEVFNRRWKMKEGAIPPNPFGETHERVVMNPPRASDSLLEPAGPVDPEVWVLAVEHSDGTPMAVLGNYSLHYVGGVPGGEISADYFGAFARKLARELETPGQTPPFVAMLSNGASGDINNINFRKPGERNPPYAQMNRVAEKLTREVLRVYNNIEFRDWVPLAAAGESIRLGVRLPDEQDIARARSIVETAKRNDWTDRSEIYARETLLLADYGATVEVPLQAMRLGDLVIGAIPCEVFVEIGLNLKHDSPFKSTFVVGLANGYYGYLPTREQHGLGGYETWRARSSFLKIDAAEKVVHSLSELLQQLRD